MKEQVIEALRSTERENIESLITFLENSDFFIAPASTIHHLAYPGGLVEHSINVLTCARALNQKYGRIFLDASIIITSITHDLCKVNYYKEVNEAPTDPQRRYLASLMNKAGLEIPSQMNKTYAGVLIDFMLKQYKGNGIIPPYQRNYQVEDLLPLGHGEKSLHIVNQFIKLTWEEALAIRWHMGAWDLNPNSPYQRYAYRDATKLTKLVTILKLADSEATHLMEE